MSERPSFDELSAQERRALLGKLLQQQRQKAQLSFAQERLWFLQELEPENAAQVVQAAVRLAGALDLTALRRSINEMLRRHEALRAVYVTRDGKPVQVIVPLVELDVSPVAVGAVAEVAVAEARQPFDLAEGPLVRARLLAVAPEEHVLLFTVHHIVSDGWSMGVLVSELAALYEAFCQGWPVPLAELPIQYADYAVWQRDRLAGELLAGQLGYWRDRLGGGPAALELPADRPRPPVQSYAGAAHTITLPAGLAAQVRRFTQEHRASLFMTALTAYTALLSRYTGQDDITVGTFIANRTRPETENLIGFFVNTLVLRTDTSGDPTFAELLGRVRETCLGGYAHQEIPFELLLAELQPERDLSRTPLFQTMLVVQNAPMPPLQLAGLQLDLLPLPSTRSNFDLTIWITEHGDRLEATFDYNTDLFDQPTIARLAGHWQTLLAAGITDPSRHLSALPLLTPAERHQLLTGWNTPATTPDGEATCLHQLFEQQAGTAPEAIAVISGTERLTYRQLNWRANQLAHHLRALGVGPDTPVALCLERSIDALVATLAILKAGGAYLPLDPAYPAHRTGFMLHDAAPPVLITRQVLAARLPTGPHTTICIDTDWPAIATQPTTNPAATIHPANLAYIIYTSGSTGTPKGVLGLHGGMVNCVRWLWRSYPFEPEEVMAQRTSLSFVDAVWETFAPLLAGIPVAIAADDVVLDPERFIRFLADHHVTRLVIVPSLLRVLLNAAPDLGSQLPELTHWFSSGEALAGDLLAQFTEQVPGGNLVNVYGTSEVSANATHYEISTGTPPVAATASAPIGRPIRGAQVYLLDRWLQPVPVGVTGEICVGGKGLARGYLNQAAMTREKFIPSPFTDGGRLYRTGDRGRYRPDGTIEYLGRADQQVKIRGFRVELGEPEAAMRSHPHVQDAAVAVHEDGRGGLVLAGYAVLAGDASLTAGELQDYLRARLPEYMVPAALVFMDSLPLTVTGKLDRRALPLPGRDRPSSGVPFVAPSTPTEEALAEIFSGLLGLGRVGANDDFFALGGHSLVVIELLAKVRERFQVDFPMRILYETSTVASLAAALESIRHAGISAAPSALDAVADFEKEGVLDASIQPARALPYTPEAEPGNVFVTGGTGFLGVHILYEVLRQTKATVYCLVRAPDVEKGKLRIKEKMEASSLWDQRFSARLVPVLGDLTKPLFGLSRERFDELADTMGALYHSGAYVNFVFPYSALKAANVRGTQEAIRLASHIRLKPLHHISLTDVALRRADDGTWYIDEEPATEYPRGIFMSGYAQTKWVAERLISIAQERGLPATIYRPGFIEGHSETGFCNTSSELCLTLKGCIKLGLAPDHDMSFDAAPVDYASKAVVYLSRQPESIGKIFNAVNTHPVPLHNVTDWISSLGYPLRRIPYDDWRREVIRVVATDPEHPLYPLLPYAVDEEIARMPLAFPCDCTHTLTGLAGSGISCPPIEPALLETCLKYMAEVGFLDQPQPRLGEESPVPS